MTTGIAVEGEAAATNAKGSKKIFIFAHIVTFVLLLFGFCFVGLCISLSADKTKHTQKMLLFASAVVAVVFGLWAIMHMTNDERKDLAGRIADNIMSGKWEQVPKEIIDDIKRELNERSPTTPNPPKLSVNTSTTGPQPIGVPATLFTH